MIDKTITHEEAIANLTSAAQIDLDLHYNYIKQQEQFSKDLVRYFALEVKVFVSQDVTADEYTEYVELYGKLIKGVAK